MNVLSKDGTTIAADRIGSGPAVVLVDAAACFRGYGPMSELAAALAGDFTVYAYDRRGRGESTDTAPYEVDREVEDLAALVEAAGGSAFVYGFSSGAALALHAAARGLAIPRLAVLEPPVILDEPVSPGPDLGAEVAELVAAGRRGDAMERFQRGIGVPAEMVEGMLASPAWPALEALAHTLVYDLTITSSLTRQLLATVSMPTLVVNSESSDDRLRSWAADLAGALPDARHQELKGSWHGVAIDDLALALTAFWS